MITTETSLTDWTMETLALYASVMVVELAVSVVVIWRMEEEVLPERIKKDRQWHNNSENHREYM